MRKKNKLKGDNAYINNDATYKERKTRYELNKLAKKYEEEGKKVIIS